MLREATHLERQAHRFASAFLVPRDAFDDTLTQLGGRITLRTLAEAKAVWGVAIKSLVGRCQAMDLIGPDQARSLDKQISSREWTKQEPVEVPLESAQWFGRVLTKEGQSRELAGSGRKARRRSGGQCPRFALLFADWDPPQVGASSSSSPITQQDPLRSPNGAWNLGIDGLQK